MFFKYGEILKFTFLDLNKKKQLKFIYMYLINYLSVLTIVLLAFVVALLVFLLSFVLFYQSVNDEKNSIYECGFVPFGDARNKFDVKFYLVSILFIVFDLEIAFLLPGVAAISKLGELGIAVLVIFLLLIAFGFVYE